MKIAVIGNYLPRQCGIATFTTNLINAILESNTDSNTEVFVVAMENDIQQHEYPPIVKHTIRQHEHKDYSKAADFINQCKPDLCIVQHEFGIFGGESGLFLLDLLTQINAPIVTTLHTILQTPNYHEKHIIKKMAELSEKMVVMSNLAVEFLVKIYKVPKYRISLIQHGVPDFSLVKKSSINQKYQGKKILSTFGFLGRSKGIETVINALPSIVKKHPNAVYVVYGKTHPNVIKHSGEEYRNYLKTLAENNKVANHLFFEDDFLDEEELKTVLSESDIYITPYLNEAQITSGTISYAVGAGACIVSTPFWHAKELLANGRGKTFDFGESEELANIVTNLLDNPEEIKAIKKNAFSYGKNMYWKKIGQLYNSTLNKVIKMNLIARNKRKINNPATLPPFSLKHLRRLTDDFGILEHANYSVPDYKEGYCLDDNSRALLLVLSAYETGLDKEAITLVDTYLRYIKLMQKNDGYFHNDISYDKHFLDEVGSEDSFGRTIWAMGYLIRLAPNDSHFQFAKDIFFKAFQHFDNIKSIRAIANITIGICHFLKRFPDNESVIHMMNTLTNKLIDEYKKESNEDWDWFEPLLSYDNAIIPLALWHVYGFSRSLEVFNIATKTTAFLSQQTQRKGKISITGNTWYYKGKSMPAVGQQPINAMAMVMMYKKAYTITKDQKYLDSMNLAFSWFLGNNDLFIPLFDEESKGCCDGLELKSVNRNQGAESTISYLLSYVTVWSTNPKNNAKVNALPLERPVLTYAG